MNASEAKAEAARTEIPFDCVYAVKAGMTRVYSPSGEVIPVTVLDLSGGTVVTQVKSKLADGYSALQLGFKAKKQQRANKAEIGHFKKAGAPAFYEVGEVKLEKDSDAAPGAAIDPSFLAAGKFVDIRGKTKGKGFQGVMKRWNFAGGRDSHGHSVTHRAPGSIGQRQTPGRVQPGKKMAGRMGNVFQTVQNISVVSFDKEQGLLLVRGAVPGGKNGIVRVSRSVKKG